jgi:hypothetical protein
VTLVDANGETLPGGTTQPNDQGAFELVNVPAGTFRLRGDITETVSSVPTISRGERSVGVVPGTVANAPLTLPMGTIAAGERELWEFDAQAGEAVDFFIVSDPRGGGASGLPVPLVDVYRQTDAVVAFGVTVHSAAGRTIFTAPATGAFVAVVRGQHTSYAGGYRLAAAASSARTFRPRSGATLTVHVVDEAGNDVPNVPLSLKVSGYGRTVTLPGTSDGEGLARFLDLAPGTYTLDLLDAKSLLAQKTGVIANVNDSPEISITRPDTGTVVAHVTRAGRGIPGRSVTILSDNALAIASRRSFTGVSAADGTVTVTDFPGHTVTATTTDPANNQVVTDSDALPAGGSADLSLPITVLATINGVVRDNDIEIVNASVTLYKNGVVVQQQNTVGGGLFQFDDVFAGTYEVQALHNGGHGDHRGGGRVPGHQHPGGLRACAVRADGRRGRSDGRVARRGGGHSGRRRDLQCGPYAPPRHRVAR